MHKLKFILVLNLCTKFVVPFRFRFSPTLSYEFISNASQSCVVCGEMSKGKEFSQHRNPAFALRFSRLRGGMPNVGMENWTSDFDRICWNESNPNILSPLFVPKVAKCWTGRRNVSKSWPFLHRGIGLRRTLKKRAGRLNFDLSQTFTSSSFSMSIIFSCSFAFMTRVDHRNPAFQDETSQKLIQLEYERLNGIVLLLHFWPHTPDHAKWKSYDWVTQ